MAATAATSWPKPEAVYAAVDHYQREIGIAAGRAVTLHVKRRAVHVVPARVAGGVMLQFLVDP